MKSRVLQIVVVEGDEDCKRDEEQREVDGEEAGPGVGECRIAHQAGGVDHGEFVNELHWVFECCVKEEAAGANEKVSDEADEEDGVVAISAAGLDAHDGEVDE